LPGCTPTKPGSASLPFFGVLPVILDEDGKELVSLKSLSDKKNSLGAIKRILFSLAKYKFLKICILLTSGGQS